MTSDQGRYHVLLIGIDAYDNPPKPLHGCVNDIDAIQRIILDQAQIPASQITRVTSPHKGAKVETSVPSMPATLENLRQAFRDLGSEKVAANDRVFIYYAGHGGITVVKQGDKTFQRESLVAIDGRRLFDIELNYLISRIVARTPAVTLILDCCQSAGATRNLLRTEGESRFVDFSTLSGRQLTDSSVDINDLDFSGSGTDAGLTEGVDLCQVVAACLNHEVAQEETSPGVDGVKHGYLTRAMINALSGLSASDIKTIPWGHVWHKMRHEVETANPTQHLWMSGSLARAVIGGPPADGDAGFLVSRKGNDYLIDAGTLAGITVGAGLAVYGPKPARFPAPGSDEDNDARVSKSLLRVTSATRETATASAEGEPFDLPQGSRARLVEAGAEEKLRCAVVPDNAKLAEALAASPLLELKSGKEAAVRLERRSDGEWVLTDDIHGSAEGEPVLVNLGQDPVGYARPILEHYRVYSLPFRMAERCADLPGALRVQLLACEAFEQPPTESEIVGLSEVPTTGRSIYELADGDTFCIRVQNTSGDRLRVALMNSAGSGRVEWLGDQIIEGGDTYVFWMANQIGEPFEASIAEGAGQCIDRLVAIGTTAMGKDLKYLQSDTSFDELMKIDRGMLGRKKEKKAPPPVEKWTATETIVRMR